MAEYGVMPVVRSRTEHGHVFQWGGLTRGWETTSGRRTVVVKEPRSQDQFWTVEAEGIPNTISVSGENAASRAFYVAEWYSRH